MRAVGKVRSSSAPMVGVLTESHITTLCQGHRNARSISHPSGVEGCTTRAKETARFIEPNLTSLALFPFCFSLLFLL
jgi:hypothetical protein